MVRHGAARAPYSVTQGAQSVRVTVAGVQEGFQGDSDEIMHVMLDNMDPPF